MPNYLPYLLLVITVLPILAVMLIRERRFLIAASWLSYSGMIYIFEVIIVVLLDAYAYDPGVVRIPYLDNMLGATASNFVTVPILAVLIAWYRLRWPWIIGFALLLGGVEVLFVMLEVYQHFWWRAYYTVAALVFFFWLARLWLRRIRQGRPVFLYLSCLMYAVCITNTLGFAFLLTGMRSFRIGLFDDAYRDDVLMTVIVANGIALLLISAMYWSDHIRWVCAAWLIILLSQYVLYRMGYVLVYIPLLLYTLAYIAALALITWLCRLGVRSFREAARGGNI